MSVLLLMAVVITHARTAQVPSSVSAAGASVWKTTGNPASVSIGNHSKKSEWQSLQKNAKRKPGKLSYPVVRAIQS